MPPTPQLDPPTTETVPQPMRPEPDLGTFPEVEPKQDNGQKIWSFSGPPHPPKGKNFES